MWRTTVSIGAALLNSRSGASDAVGSLLGFFIGALMLLLVLILPAALGVGLLGMEKELTRFSQAPEKSFAVDAAKFYKAVIPQGAFDAYAALPKAMLQAGEPGFKSGIGLEQYFQNAKWGWLALYYVAACIFFALQLAVIFGLMVLFGRVWMPLMWVPFIAAIVHYAMPLYLDSHFKHMKYIVPSPTEVVIPKVSAAPGRVAAVSYQELFQYHNGVNGVPEKAYGKTVQIAVVGKGEMGYFAKNRTQSLLFVTPESRR